MYDRISFWVFLFLAAVHCAIGNHGLAIGSLIGAFVMMRMMEAAE